MFLIPFIARWPLLSIGFGVEEDAWGHVLNGMEMAESGGYIISRLLSHPADGSPQLCLVEDHWSHGLLLEPFFLFGRLMGGR